MKTKERTTRMMARLPLFLMAGLVVLGLGLSAQPALAFCAGGAPDGFVDPGEDCDDGNLINGDGCTFDCVLEPNCVDDVTGRTNVCTANDVNLGLVLNSADVACELGTTVDLELTALLQATSAERWDIGIFVALDGGTARVGSCYQDYLRPPLAAGGTCSVTGETCTNYLTDPGLSGCPAEGLCDDGVTGCNTSYECPAPAGGGTCLVTGDACFTTADCADGDICIGVCTGGQVCDGGYCPCDGTIPYYNGEDDVDPLDTCGDLEQNVDTYYDFVDADGVTPLTITVPCQDNYGFCQGSGKPCDVATNDGCTGSDICIGDGKVDFGSCVSWDNARSDEGTGGNKPACTSKGDAVPNTKSKCRCETQNVGNVYVAGKIIVEKVCDPSTETQEFAFTSNFNFKADPDDVVGAPDPSLACGDTAESVPLEPSEISSFDYSVVEDTAPAGWYFEGVECTSDKTTDPIVNTAIDLQSGETVTCVFTNIEPNISIDKDTAALLTKTGDEVTYNIQVCYGDWDDTLETCTGANTDGPALECSIEDSVVGDVTAEALAAGCTSNGDTLVLLTPNDVCMFDLDITVPDFDGPSFSNTAIADCTIVGESAAFSDTDTISVQEFTPEFSITKDGDTLSKVGDSVTYNFTLSNDSSENTPELTCTVTDEMLGTGPDFVIWGPQVLPLVGDTFDVSYTIPEGAANPLVNTATMSCTLPEQFTNVLEDATDSHSVELFTVDFSITKDGDALSKVGDDVSYDFVLTNSSSANAPALMCTVEDSILGTVYGPAVLPAAGASFTKDYTIPDGASGSVSNLATMTCTLPDGFTNALAIAQDDHTVDLFTVDFGITKNGDALSKVGDDVSYDFVLTNSSSANAPALTCTVEDDVLGTVYGPEVLPAAGASFSVPYTIPAGASGSVTNTATMTCTLPEQFTNVLAPASDDHTVDLFTVGFDIVKTGDAFSKVGDQVTYTYTLSNTSSANTPALTCTVEDSILGTVYGPAVLPAAGDSFTKDYTIPDGASGSVSNLATMTCTLPDGFTNVLAPASDDHTVDVFTVGFDIVKTGDAFSKVGDQVTYTYTLSNTSSANTPALTCTVEDSILGTVYGPAVLPAAGDSFTKDYTIPDGASGSVSNLATMTCTLPDGFTNVLAPASDDHTVDLIAPAFDITKTGDAYSKVGDTVNYQYTLSNTSVGGAAAELTCTATDSNPAIGVIFGPAVLPLGPTAIDKTYIVQAGDANPLTNTVTLSCSLGDLFTNDLADATDNHSVDLIAPAFDITKTGDAYSKVGDTVNYQYTLSNTSVGGAAAELTCTATDSNPAIGVIFGPAVLPLGPTAIDKTYIVQAGDANPLTNTVTLSCSLGDLFTNDLADATDNHSVDLIAPAFDITKTGDAYSKVGDTVNYQYTLSNTSVGGAAAELTCTATDSNPAIGVIFGPAVLPLGPTAIDKTYIVQAGDANPLTNTVTLSCSLGDLFTNDLADATDNHSVDLIAPAFDITKTGDAYSKVGDTVNYQYTLSNTSVGGAAAELTCTATDSNPAIGVIFGPAVLPLGPTAIDKTYIVQAGDANPLTNTVTLSCELPPDLTNDLADATDNHSVDLIAPAFDITKTGDAYSKVGDTVNYQYTLSNTSVGGAAAELTCTATDSNPAIGVIFGPAVLPLGPTAIDKTYIVQAGDANPLTNTVTLSCSLGDLFTNDLADATDNHSVTLVNPSFTVAKSCTNEPVPQAGPATWGIQVCNTGDVALVIRVTDDLLAGGYVDVNVGAASNGTPTCTTLSVSDPGPFAGQASVSNTATASAVVDPREGVFTNIIAEAQASDTCVVAGEAKIIKLTQGLPNEAPNPDTRDWKFTLHDCGSSTACTKDSPVIAEVISPPSMATFSADLVPVEFDPDQRYRICEVLIPVAWTNTWMGDADDDGTPETLIPFVPAVNDAPVGSLGWSNVFDPLYLPPPEIWTNDERCINFVANAGATEVFEINNEFPGGEPRTIGYWKNWDSCSGGGQVDTAIENCGPTPADRLAGGCALLDDVLQSPGITIGELTLVDLSGGALTCDPGVEDARYILDKRSVDRNHKKMASDSAYGLAAQLLAAIANDSAGAGVCAEAGQAIVDGQATLVALGFDGTGSYCRKNRSSDCQDASTLAGILDSYNNGTLCVP